MKKLTLTLVLLSISLLHVSLAQLEATIRPPMIPIDPPTNELAGLDNKESKPSDASDSISDSELTSDYHEVNTDYENMDGAEKFVDPNPPDDRRVLSEPEIDEVANQNVPVVDNNADVSGSDYDEYLTDFTSDDQYVNEFSDDSDSITDDIAPQDVPTSEDSDFSESIPGYNEDDSDYEVSVDYIDEANDVPDENPLENRRILSDPQIDAMAYQNVPIGDIDPDLPSSDLSDMSNFSSDDAYMDEFSNDSDSISDDMPPESSSGSDSDESDENKFKNRRELGEPEVDVPPFGNAQVDDYAYNEIAHADPNESSDSEIDLGELSSDDEPTDDYFAASSDSSDEVPGENRRILAEARTNEPDERPSFDVHVSHPTQTGTSRNLRPPGSAVSMTLGSASEILKDLSKQVLKKAEQASRDYGEKNKDKATNGLERTARISKKAYEDALEIAKSVTKKNKDGDKNFLSKDSDNNEVAGQVVQTHDEAYRMVQNDIKPATKKQYRPPKPINNGFKSAEEKMDSLEQKVEDASQDIAEPANSRFKLAGEKIDSLEEKAENVSEEVKDKAQDVGSDISKEVGEKAEDTKDWASDIANKNLLNAGGVVDNAGGSVKDMYDTVVESANKGVSKMADKVIETFKDVEAKPIKSDSSAQTFTNPQTGKQTTVNSEQWEEVNANDRNLQELTPDSVDVNNLNENYPQEGARNSDADESRYYEFSDRLGSDDEGNDEEPKITSKADMAGVMEGDHDSARPELDNSNDDGEPELYEANEPEIKNKGDMLKVVEGNNDRARTGGDQDESHDSYVKKFGEEAVGVINEAQVDGNTVHTDAKPDNDDGSAKGFLAEQGDRAEEGGDDGTKEGEGSDSGYPYVDSAVINLGGAT